MDEYSRMVKHMNALNPPSKTERVGQVIGSAIKWTAIGACFGFGWRLLA